MGLVTIIFLIYMFFPSGNNDLLQNNTNNETPTGKRGENPKINNEKKNESDDLPMFLQNVKEELKSLQERIASGDAPFFPPRTEKLEEMLTSKKIWDKNNSFEKILRYRFVDINRIFDSEFIISLNKREKFDMYIALFLLRANNEMIVSQSSVWTMKELLKNSSVEAYKFIDYEVQEDYQSIPAFFYASLFIKKDTFFPPSLESLNFFSKINKIKDLSPGQIINSLRSVASYSSEIKNFTVEWREYDPLDPDDEGVYRGEKWNMQSWLKFRFIIFPDRNNNRWIKDLINSDRGAFELEDLEISEEVPVEKRIARFILYSTNLSGFIVIIDDPVLFSVNSQVDRIFKEKRLEIEKDFTKIDMLDRYRDKKKFKKELRAFGKYIYKIKDLF